MPGPPSRQAVLARLALLAATLIWGTSFVIIQRALADLPVFHLLACRFTLAALLLLPLAGRALWAEPGERWGLLRDGLTLGGFLFAGFALQTTGLLWTTPSRSAFLTSLAVVMVPPLVWLMAPARRGGPRLPTGVGSDGPAKDPSGDQADGLAAARAAGRRPWRPGPLAGAVCAAIGLYVLYRPAGATGPLGPGAAGGGLGFGRGDALTLAGTLAFACHIVAIERAVRRPAGMARIAPLAVVQFAVVALLSAPSLLVSPPRAAELTAFAVFAIVLSGVAGTALAFMCQLYAQRHLSATEAAVLLTLEPVVAALFSVAVGREAWSLSLAAGGALILAGILISELGGGPGAVPPAVAAPSA